MKHYYENSDPLTILTRLDFKNEENYNIFYFKENFFDCHTIKQEKAIIKTNKYAYMLDLRYVDRYRLCFVSAVEIITFQRCMSKRGWYVHSMPSNGTIYVLQFLPTHKPTFPDIYTLTDLCYWVSIFIDHGLLIYGFLQHIKEARFTSS